MNYTSIEQSKKLLELRLSPRTADMCYPRELYDGEIELPVVVAEWIEVDWTKNLPCWSVGALIEIMPYEITEDGDTYRLLVTHKLVQYPKLTTLWPSLFSESGETTMDAVFNMVVLLLENNLIKKG